MADARDALLAARSVHVTGSFASASSAIPVGNQRIDLRLTRGAKGVALATGSVTTVTTVSVKNGGATKSRVLTVTIAVIRVGPELFIRGDRAYYARIGPKAAAVAGRWLALPISQDRSIADLTDIGRLSTGLAGATSVSKPQAQNLGSAQALVVRTASGAVLFVAATGIPRPLQVQRPAGTAATLAGTLTFTDYDAALTVRAPKGAVALASLEG